MTSGLAHCLPPLALYVHLPWCVKKCPYCDFNSHTAGDAAPKQRYVDALLRDLDAEARRAGPREISTIFLGGGTPSLFTPAEIATVLQHVAAVFDVADDAEITMEANPGTVECGSPKGYRDAGVNRLSIGAQSFDDGMLKKLGRIHSSDEIVRTMEDARDGGFRNINIDVMHALPGQTLALAMADLSAAIALQPEHVSWYQLTLEPNTVFHARPPAKLPDDELAFAIQLQGEAQLQGAGFKRYEVSAFARAGAQCRHNLNYWLFGDYLAVGAGAHGKLTAQTTAGVAIRRCQKSANPLQYMQDIERGEPIPGLAPLSAADVLFEFMLNVLRLPGGFDEQLFCERTGLAAESLAHAARESVRQGLIARQPSGRWQATQLGNRFLNDLQGNFLGSDDKLRD